MEQWGQPRIVLALVHPREAAAEMLSRTLRALQHAHYVGDSVELRLALHGSAIDDKEVCVNERARWINHPINLNGTGPRKRTEEEPIVPPKPPRKGGNEFKTNLRSMT